MGTPVLEQLAINWLMSTGGWEQAVEVRRSQARENRDALVEAVRRELPDWEFTVPRGGLTLWVRTGGISGSRLAVAGERVGVRVPSGPRFGVDGAFEVRTAAVHGERAGRGRGGRTAGRGGRPGALRGGRAPTPRAPSVA